MANLIITDLGSAIEVDFNDKAALVGMLKGTWRKDQIINFVLKPNDEFIQVNLSNSATWEVTGINDPDRLRVDKVGLVAPIDNAHLYSMLKALL